MIYQEFINHSASNENTEHIDHTRFYFGNKTKNYFVSLAKTMNLFPHLQDISEIEKLFSFFIVDESGQLYAENHLSLTKNSSLFCYMWAFPESSPVWWSNLLLSYKNNKNIFPTFLFSLIHASKNRSLLYNADNIILSDHNDEYDPILGGSELPDDEIPYLLNYCLEIEGWDINNPPIVIAIFGNDSPHIPRFLDKNAPKGKNLEITFFTDNGKISDVFIVNGGNNYKKHDILSVIQEDDQSAKLIVEKVNNGSVCNLMINNQGISYNVLNNYIITTSGERIPYVNTSSGLTSVMAHPFLELYFPSPKFPI